jgi:hypothetical protein
MDLPPGRNYGCFACYGTMLSMGATSLPPLHLGLQSRCLWGTEASRDAMSLPPLAPTRLGLQLDCLQAQKFGDDIILSSMTTTASI